MIILLDNFPHCDISVSLIRQIYSDTIELINLPEDMSIKQSHEIANQLLGMVTRDCVVICPWCVTSDLDLDDIFTEISEICPVIVAAGNFNREIEYYSPAKAHGVIAVGALNKKGEPATFSNFSYIKSITWAPGTNINIDGSLHSGTSISCVLYGAALAESIKTDVSIHTILDKYKETL